MGWLEDLKQARRTAFGAVLHFNTDDWLMRPDGAPLKLLPTLAATFAADGIPCVAFTTSRGLEHIRPPVQLPPLAGELQASIGMANPMQALPLVQAQLCRPGHPLAFIVDHAEHLAGAPGGPARPDAQAALELLHALSMNENVRHSGSFVVLVVRHGALHPLVAHGSGFRSIQVGLPDLLTLKEFTRHLRKVREQVPGMGELARQFTTDDFARAASGLRLVDVEQLFRDAGADGRQVDLSAIRLRKRESIRAMCEGLVEVFEPDQSFDDVAGCDAAKDYLRQVRKMWRAQSPSTPAGLLFNGPPGTGKSFLIKALASELEAPCIMLRGVREPWVGSSERNLERVLEVVESLAPCIFWTDEIDQQLGGRDDGGSGDSGTSGRMFGRILEFFGDARLRGRVLWVATSNRPDLLDYALLDRFSRQIPLLHPTAVERALLIPNLARQSGRALADDADAEEFASLPAFDGLSVRQLREIVDYAGMLADLRTNSAGAAITQADLMRAGADYQPERNSREHELMALTSIATCSFNSLLPWMGPEGLRPGHGWPAYLDGIVDTDTGFVNRAALADRIASLRRGTR